MVKKILVVDDEEMIRRSTTRYLKMKGYDVIQAESAERALEILRAEAVDLVVTDYRLPGMNGLELATAIKKDDPGLPVFVFTGDAIPVGDSNGVFEKPDIAELVAGVEKKLQA